MKTPDVYYREAAEKLNLPLGLVKAANKFYWKEGIKANLSNVVYNSIFIKNLATIVISRYKLNRYILEIIAKIRRVERSIKYTEKMREVILAGYKNNLRKLLKKRNQIINEQYFLNGKTY